MLRKVPFLLALLMLACLGASGQDPQRITIKPVCKTSFTIPTRSSETCTFDAPPGLRRVRIVGEFRVSGGPDDTIEVWVMDDAQFTKWQNQHSVETIYNSKKLSQGLLNLFLTQPGKFHVIFSNDSSDTPKSVEARLTLRLVR